jgi:putative ABC transport system permease protein
MRFTALIFKNLIRRPLRSALTLLALTTAIAAVVALLGISQGFTRSFSDVYAAHGVDIVVSRQGSADRLSSSIDADFSGKITELPHVRRAAAVLLETLSLEDEGIYGIPSMGIEPDSWLRDDYRLESNQIDSTADQIDPMVDPTVEAGAPMATESPPNIGMSADIGQGRNSSKTAAAIDKTVWLGIHLAERVGVEVGGQIQLFDEPYRVSAIFKSLSSWENGSMILPLAELQHLTDRPGQATYINVVLQPADPMEELPGERAQRVLTAIADLDPKLLPLATESFVESDTRMQLASAMAWMTSMIALLLGSIGTLNTMLTSVMERTREIGILRAIGWPKRRVVSMILLESCGLAVLASILGIVLAMVLTWSLAQAPAAKGILSPSIDGLVIAQGFALALGIGLLGALLPAWRAAQLLPTEAFREQ